MGSKFKERRREARRDIELDVYFAPYGKEVDLYDWVKGKVLNATPSGVSIRASKLPKPNQVLRFYFFLPGRSDGMQSPQYYPKKGVVRWTDPKRETMGVEFI